MSEYWKFAYNSSKAAATHLTKLFATEFALKKIPIRVNSVAPGAPPHHFCVFSRTADLHFHLGVYESEMTIDTITPELVDKVAKGTLPVPAARTGK